MSLTAGSGTSGEAWRRRYVGWGAVGVLAPLSWVNPLLGEPGFENSRVRLSRAGSIGRRCAKERSFLGLQAFPVEAWSTFAAVNQSFSEALPGGERKSSAAASSSPHLLSAWLLSHCLFSRILSARSWFAHAGRSALAANGRFAAQRLDPEGNGLQLLERHLLQRAGGRCARAISVGLRQGTEKRDLQASTRGRSFARIVWLSLVLWIDACKAFLWVW